MRLCYLRFHLCSHPRSQMQGSGPAQPPPPFRAESSHHNSSKSELHQERKPRSFFSVQLRQLGRGLCLVILDTHPMSLSIQGIWDGLPKPMPGKGVGSAMEGRDGDCWQLFHKWHFRTGLPNDVLITRSLLATASCQPELKLGARPGPHPAHCLLGDSDLLQQL